MNRRNLGIAVGAVVGFAGVSLLAGAGKNAAPGEQWEYAAIVVTGEDAQFIQGGKITNLPKISFNRYGGDNARIGMILQHLDNLGAEGWDMVDGTGSVVQGRIFMQRRR